jgi:shikimate kinase
VYTRNVILVGFMGTGKSTVGKLLAERLKWSFTDMDEWIEREQKTRIRELFRLHGEAHFRTLESDALRRLLLGEKQILATGGGAVLAQENRTTMLKNGFVVALTADSETIIHRVSSDQNRPLLQGNLEERVHMLLKERIHAYEFAHTAVNTTGLSVAEIVEQIIKRMELETS